jgi:hypothetical protein
MVRKEMTRAVYFCNQCQKVESHITFTPEKKVAESSQASGEDLYWNYKAFRRSPSF